MVKILKICDEEEGLVCTYCHEPIIHGQVFLSDNPHPEALSGKEDQYYHRECMEDAGISLLKYKVVGLDEL